jgi:hypothetical protein
MSRIDVGFTEVVDLACAPADVFWHMVHPDTAPTIDPTIIEWRSDDWPPKEGSLNRLKAIGPARIPMRLVSRFTEFEPPKRMVIEGVRPFFSKWTRGVHDIEQTPSGTRYTYRVEMRPPLLFRLPYKAMARRLLRGVQEGCVRLTERFGSPA